MPTLTEAQIRAAKPKEKLYKLYNARGLICSSSRMMGVLIPHIYVWWEGECCRLGCIRSLKRAQRQGQKTSNGVTFELVAKEWLELQRDRFAAATFVKAEWPFTDLISP
jgi:hypothetical protein